MGSQLSKRARVFLSKGFAPGKCIGIGRGPVSVSFLSSPRRCRAALLLLAGLAAAVAAAPPAQAADNAVQVACPELSLEQSAEIESRVRASLLTTEGEATVAVTCHASSAEVQVERAQERVVVTAPTSPASFRDDVLRAVEQALNELMRRQARANDAGGEAPPVAPTPSATAAPQPTPEPATPAPVARPAPTPARPVSTPKPNERAWTEIFGALAGEAWPDRWALGGSLGVARSTRRLWYGFCAAVLRPTSQATFSALEAQVAAEVGVQPAFATGVRLSFALGPSVLFVQPQGELTARGDNTAKASLFAAVHVSRPVWFGSFGLVPKVGLRVFTDERGVTVDGVKELVLSGFVPQLSLGVAYRID